ncbi:hypothetical protein Pla110_09490 [Polystyrenella longa]|uniref:Uncharacterized protein n=1 Tax=Polystyrenella longa TaxID=2528007 RepID=A0A518CJ32_9PLAN|nr:DUF5009 domain-containing protein [Polystyrenella longa]QDU79243.1 hypothetical protein Pla110_09490 [Polystyrenella longa]
MPPTANRAVTRRSSSKRSTTSRIPAMTQNAPRLASLDAFRGFVMLAMVSGGLALGTLAEKFPGKEVYEQLAFHTEHVAWAGVSFWDLIQPSFMFMVGVALVYSYDKRKMLGQSWISMFLHVLWRSALLIVLGWVLRSNSRDYTYWTLEDVIQQIGLGYPFLFLLWNRPRIFQWTILIVIIVGYWSLFAFYPLPGENFDPITVNADPTVVPQYEGFQAHWNKNANPAHDADIWLLNQFPREEAFTFNSGGYNTLNFIPSLITMIIGLLIGQMLKRERSRFFKWILLVVAGAACLGIGYAAHYYEICPIVKRIWTPSWAVYSAGWALVILSVFYFLMDLLPLKFLGWPFLVVGMNSIAIYVMNALISGWLMTTFVKHFGNSLFTVFGDPYEAIVKSSTELILLWLICFWMYRNRFFVRI